MALNANIAWEVRQTGSATNGGGFKAGASGTDWTLQDAAQYSVTDAVTNGTTTITSATANFGADVVGNVLYITGGTGAITAGWYEITARNSATSITVDRSTGLTTGTGATLKIGGALATIAQAAAVMVASNKIFVRRNATVYDSNATTTISVSTTPTNGTPPTRLIGYYQTRGDCTVAAVKAGTVTRPTLRLITNTGLTGIACTGNGIYVEGLIIDCNNLGTSTGISHSGDYSEVKNCKILNSRTYGINASATYQTISDNEVTACAATAAINSAAARVYRNHVHDNTCTGINTGSTTYVFWNLVVNNTGSSSDGIVSGQLFGGVILHNTVSGNGRHGIVTTTSYLMGVQVRDNVIANHTAAGAAGFQGAAAAGWAADPSFDGNAYYNNTSHRSNADDTGSVNPINGVAPYTNTLDVICTADPFTNAAGGDFSLNNTAGGGAAIRAHGVPGIIPGSTPTGSLDMGVFQHADPAGGGTTYVVNKMINYYLGEPES
jgi:hypothetical protein